MHTDETPGARVRRLREKRGWGQVELALKCAWPEVAARVSNYERGERPIDVEAAEALAQAFGTSAAHILFGLDPERLMEVSEDERAFILTLRAQFAARSAVVEDRADRQTDLKSIRQPAVDRPTRRKPKPGPKRASHPIKRRRSPR